MKPKFYRKVLRNGFTVLLEKRDLPIVSVAFAVRTGAIDEKQEDKGISHFIEHLLYKGTPNRDSKKIAEEIEKKGGELNGFTDEDIVAYWCKMPSSHLNVALDVLSDMVKNPLFNEKEIEKERLVIFEEIKMYNDNPRLHVFNEIKSCLYENPFGLGIAGTFDTMKNIDREKIIERFKKFYSPDNLILCVVGDADFDELVKFAEENFGDEKTFFEKQKIILKNKEKIEKRKGIDQANLVFGYHSPLIDDNLNYASRVLITLLAGGMSSRLFSEIREKRNLAYAVKGDIDSGKDYSYSVIYVGTTKENVEEVKKLILTELEKVSKDLTEKELEEIKKQLIGNYQISMEDSQTQMVNLLGYEIAGDSTKFYDFKENILSVKLEDVKSLAEKAKKEYSFFALVPED